MGSERAFIYTLCVFLRILTSVSIWNCSLPDIGVGPNKSSISWVLLSWHSSSEHSEHTTESV